MFISHLTFISKPMEWKKEEWRVWGDAIGIGKVGSIRGNPSVCFLLLELPLAESSARSGRGRRLQSLFFSSPLPQAMQRLVC